VQLKAFLDFSFLRSVPSLLWFVLYVAAN
jgi:ABC-type phosphate/phosphonate transport system permease subunit